MIKVRIHSTDVLEEAKEDDLYQKYSDKLWWKTMRGVELWLQQDRKSRLKAMPWLLKQLAQKEAPVWEEWKNMDEKDGELVFRDRPADRLGSGGAKRGGGIPWAYGLDPAVMGMGLEDKVVNAHLTKQLWFDLKKAHFGFNRRFFETYATFLKHNKQLELKGINQYTDLDHLASSIQRDVYAKRAEKGIEKFNQLSAADATRLPMPSPFTMIKPKSTEASCTFGKGSRWCISQKDNKHFDDYAKKHGKVFYFVQDHSRKPDDKFYKVAVQVIQDKNTGKTVIELVWDRYDNDSGSDTLGRVYGNDIAAQIIKNIEDNMGREGPIVDLVAQLGERIRVGKFDEDFRDGEQIKFYFREIKLGSKSMHYFITAHTVVNLDIPYDGIDYLAKNFGGELFSVKAEEILNNTPKEELDLVPELNNFDGMGYDFEVEASEEGKKILFAVQLAYDESDDDIVQVQVKHTIRLNMKKQDGEVSALEKTKVIKDWIEKYSAIMGRARSRRDLRRAIKRVLIKDESTGIWVSDNMNRQYREDHPETVAKGAQSTWVRGRQFPDDVVGEGKILAEKKPMKGTNKMIKININTIEVLDEAKEDDLLVKYSKKLPEIAMKRVFSWIGSARRQRLRYADWILKQYSIDLEQAEPYLLSWYINLTDEERTGRANDPDGTHAIKRQRLFHSLMEIGQNLTKTVQKFSENLPSMKNKDINSYKSSIQLEQSVYKDVDLRIAKKNKKDRAKHQKPFIEHGESEIVYEDDRFFVLRPNTDMGSCFFGKKTKWCIAQDGNSYFDEYTEEGRVFYFIIDDTKKEDDQFSKIAVEANNEGLIQIWDRYDDSHEIGDLENIVDWGDGYVERIIDKIGEHLADNPPQTGKLAKLQAYADTLNNGAHNTSYISFEAEVEDYDDVYIRIDPQVYWDFQVPIPFEASGADVEEAWGEQVDFIIEEFAELDYINDFIDYDPHDVITMDFRWGRTDSHPVVSITMRPWVEDSTSYTVHDAEAIVESIEANFDASNIKEFTEQAQKIIYKNIAEIIQSPGVEKFKELYSQIEEIEKNYKHFWADYAESDWTAGIDFIVKDTLPIEIPAFLLQVPREWMNDANAAHTYNVHWRQRFTEYKRFVSSVIKNADYTRIYGDAIAKHAGAAWDNAVMQTKLNFKDVSFGDIRDTIKGLGGSYFSKFDVAAPNDAALKGDHRLGGDISVKARSIVEMEWIDSEENLELIVRWVAYVDKHWDEIKEAMRPTFENMSVEIRKKYKQIRNKFLSDMEVFADLRKRGREGDEDPVTEDKKKKKIRIRMKNK